jgi:hypothetical protein
MTPKAGRHVLVEDDLGRGSAVVALFHGVVGGAENVVGVAVDVDGGEKRGIERGSDRGEAILGTVAETRIDEDKTAVSFEIGVLENELQKQTLEEIYSSWSSSSQG